MTVVDNRSRVMNSPAHPTARGSKSCAQAAHSTDDGIEITPVQLSTSKLEMEDCSDRVREPARCAGERFLPGDTPKLVPG